MTALTTRYTPCILLLCCILCFAADQPRWKLTRSIPAAEAHQAAAADKDFAYAISSEVIAKHDRKTGQRIALSTGPAHHLNSGFFYKGQLYCAHSNYPQTPESSQIMLLDPATMRLFTFRDFGNFGGSLTWAIREDHHWWCNFALYGKENGRTFLVKFDEEWREIGRWTYPPQLIRRLGQWSLSGGVWLDGRLCVTGHNDPILFRLRLPREGNILEWVDEQVIPFTGQGIALDPTNGGLVGINRDKKQILFAQPPGARP